MEPQSMAEELDVEIVSYDPQMADDLAAMYNSWDDLWIGGFTQGVPFDGQRVRDRYDKMSAIDILIAVKKSDSKPVGSCTVHEHWRDSDAAYIGVLGVSPEALGKKVGKKLLLRAIEIVRSKGYERVDLNTWAGNMRAVPLYKKVGLMWNPEGEGVHMEDYIPGILEHPLCKPFFEGMSENEWYEWLQREIKQTPDRMKHRNMDVYEYNFQRGEDTLTVKIDRYARGVFSIGRKIGGQRISITSSITDHNVLCGIPRNYNLEIHNDTSERKSINVQLSAFGALSFGERASTDLEVEPGEVKEWSVPFNVDSTAPIHRKNRRTPKIVAQLKMDGEMRMELHTGMVIKPIADVQDRWPHSRVLPGGSVEVPLIVMSSIAEEIHANLILETSDSSLSVHPEQVEMRIPNKGISGAIAEVNAAADAKAGSFHLNAKIEMLNISETEQERVETRAFRIPIFCSESGDVTVFEDKRKRDIIVNGMNYQATFGIEGANLDIRDIYTRESLYRARSQIGPPFGIDSFRYAEREYSIEEEQDGITVRMRGRHPERPLMIDDCVHFERNSGIIRHEVWTKNTGKVNHDFQLRVYGGGQGISLSPGEIIVPLGDRIVKQPLLHGLFTHPSVPSSPSAFNEGWIAAKKRGMTKGQVFDLGALDEIRLGSDQMFHIQYPLTPVAPGETKRASRYWLKTNANSWQQIQQLWMEKVKRSSTTIFGDKRAQKTTGMVDIATNPSVICQKQECKIQFEIEKLITAPISADVMIEPPPGWTVTLVTDENKNQQSNHLGDINLEENRKFIAHLTPTSEIGDKFSIHKGTITLQAATTYRKDFFIIQTGESDEEVKVEEIEDEGISSFEVINGLIDFRLSHKYGGCMYSLRNKRGTQLLFSTFPEGGPKPGAFFDNYHGGIQPIVWDSELGEELSNAETNKELMTGEVVRSGIWCGVEFNWVGKIQEPLHGVQFRLQYLTAPSSPLIAARWIIKNTTNAPINLRPAFMVDPAFDGEVSAINAHTDWEGIPQRFRLANYPISVMPSSNYILIENTAVEEGKEGLGIAAPFDDAELLFVAAGDLILTGSIDSNRQLMPGDEHISTTWFLIDPESVEELSLLQTISDELI
ncbi:GNAT family N-acetyltransferase [Candidatus Thorarchaeota archaeon]|nr:MAG: GNAT family N-acetyltransferase [Candidatus Thorarchaeota archaeon]